MHQELIDELNKDVYKVLYAYIAAERGISVEEVLAKYSPSEPIALSKMKKVDLVKECMNLGIQSTGSVIELKRILKNRRISSGIRTTRGNKKKNLKKVAPLHNHELCTDIREDCLLCQSHGNVMSLGEIEYEMIIS